MVGIDPVAEHPLAAPQDDRVEREPVFVDQVMAQELVDQIRAAIHDEVTARLRLELRDLGGDVA